MYFGVIISKLEHCVFSIYYFIFEIKVQIQQSNFAKNVFSYFFKPIFGLSDKIGLLVPLEVVQACWFIGKKIQKPL